MTSEIDLYAWERCTHEGIGRPGCPTCDPDKHRVAARYERRIETLRGELATAKQSVETLQAVASTCAEQAKADHDRAEKVETGVSSLRARVRTLEGARASHANLIRRLIRFVEGCPDHPWTGSCGAHIEGAGKIVEEARVALSGAQPDTAPSETARQPMAQLPSEERLEIFWGKTEGLREAAVSGDHRKLFVWYQEFVDGAEGHLRAEVERLKAQVKALQSALALPSNDVAEREAVIAELRRALDGFRRLKEDTEATYEDAYDSMFKSGGQHVWDAMNVALAQPAPQVALRAFGLKVARAVEGGASATTEATLGTIVDAVLKGEP